jgi:hypothetical protein
MVPRPSAEGARQSRRVNRLSLPLRNARTAEALEAHLQRPSAHIISHVSLIRSKDELHVQSFLIGLVAFLDEGLAAEKAEGVRDIDD